MRLVVKNPQEMNLWISFYTLNELKAYKNQRRAFNSAPSSSKPGFPRRANMFSYKPQLQAGQMD